MFVVLLLHHVQPFRLIPSQECLVAIASGVQRQELQFLKQMHSMTLASKQKLANFEVVADATKVHIISTPFQLI